MQTDTHLSPKCLREYTLSNAPSFLELLQKLSEETEGLLYRGVGDAAYDLLPSALRDSGFAKLLSIFRTLPPNKKSYDIRYDSDRAIVEYFALCEFYKASNLQGLSLPSVKHHIHEFMVNGATQSGALLKLEEDFFGHIKWPIGNFEQPLALAQHYGLPTRLLDWSDDMFAAAYFAAQSGIRHLRQNTEPRKNLAVWIVSRHQINLMNRGSENNIGLPCGIKLIDVPYAGNPNLAAQRGVFSLVIPKRLDPKQFTPTGQFSLLSALESIDSQTDSKSRSDVFGGFNKPFVVKIMVPISEAKELMRLLHRRGYNYARLFPGYAGSIGAIDELLDLNT